MKMNLFKAALLSAVFFNLNAMAQKSPGWVLASVMNSTTATLLDTIQPTPGTFKTWSNLDAATGYSSYLEPGGILTRSAKVAGPSFSGGPICGKIQKHDYNGNLTWDFTYSTQSYCTHHDIKPMPNGNVLAIAYERRTAAEVTAAGGNNSIEMWPDKIIEVQPTGPTTGTVVWEWKIWDHIMQNVDPGKPNYYANVIDHPELLNINYKQAKDWIHMNGVDYNPILDQVIFSSHNTNEWYIIDHSTTTAEAAGHTGGNSGKGGDFLYRWGNPAAYGAAGTAVLNVTHDAHWIKEGCPNAGHLVGFNNKGVTTPSNKSCVDRVQAPVNGYNYTYTAGQAFTPTTYTARHVGNGYTSNMGGSQQFPNGNQLVTIAVSGVVYEIDSAGNQLWTKTYMGSVPKAFKYDSCYIFNTPPAIPAITANATTLTSTSATTYQWYRDGVLIPGATSMTYTPTQSGVFVVRITDANGCIYRYSSGYKFTMPNAVKEIDLGDAVTVYPNPASNLLYINDKGVLGAEFQVQLIDMAGNTVMHSSGNRTLDLSGIANGLYNVRITSANGNASRRVHIMK